MSYYQWYWPWSLGHAGVYRVTIFPVITNKKFHRICFLSYPLLPSSWYYAVRLLSWEGIFQIPLPSSLPMLAPSTFLQFSKGSVEKQRLFGDAMIDHLSWDCDFELILTHSLGSSSAEATSFHPEVFSLGNSSSKLFKPASKFFHTSWGASWEIFSHSSVNTLGCQELLTCSLHFCLGTWVLGKHKAGTCCTDLLLDLQVSVLGAV